MSTNSKHINQLAAIIREVDGSHTKGAADLAKAILSHPGSMWQPPAALAQPEGDAMPFDLIRKLLQPAYEPGDGTADGAQQVNLAWWHPVFGSDSLQVVIDNAYYLLARCGRPAAPPPLPANYIDPEHQGEARELLQTFYRACQAEGGTADEIYLRGIRAVLAARPAAAPAPEYLGGSITDGQREAARSAVAQALGDTYDCTRVWEAWSAGTMGPDDFELVAADDDRVAEIADAAIEAIRAIPAPQAGEVGELVVQLKADAECVAAGQSDAAQAIKHAISEADAFWNEELAAATLRAAAAQMIKTDDLTDTAEDIVRGAERHHQAGWLCTIPAELEIPNV